MATNMIDLSGILGEYAHQVKSEVEQAQTETVKEAVQNLRTTSPKGHGKTAGKYAKGWASKKQGKVDVVYNRTDYQLTHLLEDGHANRDGSRTAARPHIKQVEEQAIETFTKKVTDIAGGK